MKHLLENWREKLREYETQHEALKVPRGYARIKREGTPIRQFWSWHAADSYMWDGPDDVIRAITLCVWVWSEIRLGLSDPGLNQLINEPSLYENVSIGDFTDAIINEATTGDLGLIDQFDLEGIETKKDEIINSAKNKIKKKLDEFLTDLEQL